MTKPMTIFDPNSGERPFLNTVGQPVLDSNLTVGSFKCVDVAVTAAALDGGGSVNVINPPAGSLDQYKIRDIKLVGGGTSYGAGGDRTIVLTDGTTTWTTVPNASIEAAPAASVPFGNTAIPFLTGTINTPSTAGGRIRFQYAGGTTDHGGVGSITFQVTLEKVA